MRRLMILSIFLVLISGCTKKSTEQKELLAEVQHAPVTVEAVTVNAPDIIDSEYQYKPIQDVIENYDPKYAWLFQVEGNFTNSGNKEILAFYQSKRTSVIEGKKHSAIDYTYCFVCDPSGEKIINTYGIYYRTGPFEPVYGLDTAPLEALGRDVFWLEEGRIGCIGDFNNNGKEELFLFEGSGLGIDQMFFEFDGTQFVKILNYDQKSVFLDMLTEVDVENKIITFKGWPPNSSFIWDEHTQRYELLSDD